MGAVSVIAGAASGSSFPNGWESFLLAVIGSSLFATLIGGVIAGLRASAAQRRDRYATSVGRLVAWQEYPYRIRRRTSDTAEALKELADLGHTLQEQLAGDRAWIASENKRTAVFYDQACSLIRTTAGDAARDAWTRSAVVTAADMNLGGGLSTQSALEQQYIDALNTAIRWRFGWRRVLPRRAELPKS
ncbi:hypothetical protein acdb102_33470 [Acidothermaceae bacterium B102]|nr:hypothetical protein acdb102_33470 [Acidothermaceae bacterium B102]